MIWGKQKVKELGIADNTSVLEVGARNVNGSLREHFRTGWYIGSDMQEGQGVDVVARADKLPFDARSFDVVVCTEMLEHDPFPWKSIPEMARVLRPGGYLILTCRGVGFHDDPNPKDYWRFTTDSIDHLFTLAKLKVLECIPDTDPTHEGVFAVGQKKGSK